MASASKKKKFTSRVLPGIIFILLALAAASFLRGFDVRIDRDALHGAVESGEVPAELMQGTQVVCFYSMVCPYCEKNAQWLERTRSRFGMKDVPLTVIFGRPSVERNPQDFFDACGLEYDRMEYLDQDIFLEIVCGRWPLVLVLRDGKIVHKFTHRGL